MNSLFIMVGLVGLSAVIFGIICIYQEIKDQVEEANEIVDKFKRRNKK